MQSLTDSFQKPPTYTAAHLCSGSSSRSLADCQPQWSTHGQSSMRLSRPGCPDQEREERKREELGQSSGAQRHL